MATATGYSVWDRPRILKALIIRDMMMRFGRSNLGFVWTILEPMILTSGVLVVWSVLHPSLNHGISIIGLVLTGYMPLTLWRHLTNPAIRLFSRYSGILYHAPVSHIDFLLARMILEFASTTMAFAIIYFLLLTTGLVDPIADWSMLLAGWLMTGWYYFGVGCITAAATEYSEPLEKFVQPLQYLSLPLSGVFFMVDWLPSWAQQLILWNPSVHFFEMFRAGFFGDAVVTHYEFLYPILVCAGLSTVGLVAVVHIREHIEF